jgi:hypothetical protein
MSEGIMQTTSDVCDKVLCIEEVALEFDVVIAMGQSKCVQRLTCLRETEEGFGSLGIVHPDFAWTRCDQVLFVGEVGEGLCLIVIAEEFTCIINNLWGKRK